MTRKIFSVTIIFLGFFLAACQGTPSLRFFESTSTPTLTVTPTFTATPTVIITISPTLTRIMLSRVIPKDFYIMVKIKYTMFKDGKAESVCIFTNTHRTTKIESDEVVAVAAQVEYQKVLGNCPSIPEPRNFKLNVFTGETIETNPENSSGKDSAYYGKNYQDTNNDIFSLSNPPIPVWKIIEPYNQKDILGKLDIYAGTQEKLIDKVTGILIYRKSSYNSVQDPTITIVVKTISVSTNAPIGGLLNGTEFTYSENNDIPQ